jgi:hypothetical protein
MDGTAVLAGLDIEKLSRGNPLTEVDMALVDPMLDAALATLPGMKVTLEKMGGLKDALPAFNKDVRYWREQLQKSPSNPLRSLQAPRHIVCGALAAWEAVTTLDRPERKAAMPVLTKNTIEILRKSGPKDTRAKIPGIPEARKHGEELAGWLLKAARRPGPQNRKE